jgi:hypothetical protein
MFSDSLALAVRSSGWRFGGGDQWRTWLETGAKAGEAKKLLRHG